MNERLSDQVCDKVTDALMRMLAFGEQVAAIDFSLSSLVTPDGLMPVGIVYVALKGPVLGSVLFNLDIVLDVSQVDSQAAIDSSVRTGLDSIRARKAALLAEAVTLHRP